MPVFLPEKSHGQRSLASYSSLVAESDAVERMSMHSRTSLFFHPVYNTLPLLILNTHAFPHLLPTHHPPPLPQVCSLYLTLFLFHRYVDLCHT